MTESQGGNDSTLLVSRMVGWLGPVWHENFSFFFFVNDLTANEQQQEVGGGNDERLLIASVEVEIARNLKIWCRWKLSAVTIKIYSHFTVGRENKHWDGGGQHKWTSISISLWQQHTVRNVLSPVKWISAVVVVGWWHDDDVRISGWLPV